MITREYHACCLYRAADDGSVVYEDFSFVTSQWLKPKAEDLLEWARDYCSTKNKVTVLSLTRL